MNREQRVYVITTMMNFQRFSVNTNMLRNGQITVQARVILHKPIPTVIGEVIYATTAYITQITNK
ncbi:MAG: hypothetical protein C4523_12720 [Myxococcales bacterium]|nr:MAG: hypothetical protein C4523_12720 [Myxococcales bacterium]